MNSCIADTQYLVSIEQHTAMTVRELDALRTSNWIPPVVCQGMQGVGALLLSVFVSFALYPPIVVSVEEAVVQKSEPSSALNAEKSDHQTGSQVKMCARQLQQFLCSRTALQAREKSTHTQEARCTTGIDQYEQQRGSMLSKERRLIHLGLDVSKERVAIIASTSQLERTRWTQLSVPAQERVAKKVPADQIKFQAPGHVFLDSLENGGHGPEMITLASGTFAMGSRQIQPFQQGHDSPQHVVTISRSFALSVAEITFDDYEIFVIETGQPMPRDEGWGRGTRPVINVSWEDATDYAEWLTQQTGKTYRLPTEAEWEYAARAGTTSVYSFGDEPKLLPDYAWFLSTSGGLTQPVKQLKANPWGLHDMHGNVLEWVQGWYNEYPAGPRTDPTSPPNGTYRVVRGGSWDSSAVYCSSSYRITSGSNDRDRILGFRVARELD